MDIPATFLYASVLTVQSTVIYIGFALTAVSAAQCAMTTVSLLCGLFVFGLCGNGKISPAKVIFVLLCVSGVVLVIQPWHRHKYDECISISEVSNISSVESKCISLLETQCKLYGITKCSDKFHLCRQKFKNNLNNTGIINQKREFCTSISTAKDTTDMCSDVRTCWLELTNIRNRTQQPSTNGTKLLLLHLPEEYVSTVGIVFSGFSGIMYTMLILVIKRNPCLSEHRFRSLFWTFLTCLICSTTLTFTLEDPVLPKTLFDTTAVAAHCVASVSTVFFMVYAMQLVSGPLSSIILSSSVVLFLIPQYTILSSVLPGNKNWMEVVGVFLVLLGSFSASVHEMITLEK